jgi:hypothetical protein
LQAAQAAAGILTLRCLVVGFAGQLGNGQFDASQQLQLVNLGYLPAMVSRNTTGRRRCRSQLIVMSHS